MAELKECAHLVESVAQQLDARCRTWKETLDRAYKDGRYNQNTGLWEIDECKTSRARYTLDAYRDALALVDTLGQQIDDLLRHPAPENKALTLEELREMDGEPVWCVQSEAGESFWALYMDKASLDQDVGNAVHVHRANLQRVYGVSYGARYSNYGKTWIAYRAKPEEDGK